MKIVTGVLTLPELSQMAADTFGNFVKAVVDVEALLLEKGSKQKNLWGINLYPEMQGDDLSSLIP